MDIITLAEIGIAVFVWLLFPNRFAYINLFFLALGLMAIYFSQPYVSPFISQKEYKKTAIHQIEEIDLFFPVASSLKDIKPNLYEELISDISWNHVITQKLTEKEKVLSDYKIILRLFSRFLHSAFDVDVFKYIQAHLKFIRELNQIDPHSVLQFSYPQLFGLLDFDTLIKAHSRFIYHKAVANVIESGKLFFVNPLPDNGKYFYKMFFVRFKVRHPAETSVLEAAYTAQTPAHRQFLAKSVLLFHSEIAGLSQKEACDIWRYMLSSH